ncbi:hypothetical protein [Chlamydia sp. 17-3921]|uniref:hypothetical protein n=1 Tax=Chlamydia sp. 17-3921 TaxID=2675798 RepID=UPI00191A2AC3|nr:hypothetical protein [Chlamydia sp. 17-3921]
MTNSTTANSTPKTKISFPTFIRLDITSKNLTEDKKKQSFTVEGGISTENTKVTENISITEGGLDCQQNLKVGKEINVTPTTSSSMDFRGRLNLADSHLYYKNSTSNLRSDYRNINDRANQQYVPFGEFKRNKVLYTERSATSNGAAFWGDFPGGARIPWMRFNTQSLNSTGAVSINDNKLEFTATSLEPKLLCIRVFMTKDGRWLDNGTGGECALGVSLPNGTETILAVSTCSGQSNYRTRPMVWFCSTFYATTNGHFFLKNNGGTFRVRFFSWNVTILPYVL